MEEYGILHIFGVKGGVSYLTVQGDDFAHKFALDVEVKNEDGVVVTDRLDDERIEVSIDGTMKSEGSESLLGSTFGYGGVTFIVKDVTDRGTNSDYRKVTIKGVKYQAIS